jgi:hypothetical protein
LRRRIVHRGAAIQIGCKPRVSKTQDFVVDAAETLGLQGEVVLAAGVARMSMGIIVGINP